ncbi:MAG: hypothetical protein IT210_20030 [Armatimonadetes bacterium]|nr:hypothetical protein [Armatimonadota bacterium]
MNTERIQIPTESSFKPPAALWAVCTLAVAIGAGGLVAAFAANPRDGWLWLLIDFTVFAGIGIGALMWAAVFRVAQARWTPALNRLAHGILYFMPVLFAAMILLLMGVRNYAPWTHHHDPLREAWLNVPFMVARNLFSFGLLWALLAVLVRWTLGADARWKRGEAIPQREQFRMTALGTGTVFWFTIAASIISYDFIMSLSPEWASTMFAPYYWVTSLYTGMAALVVMAAFLKKAVNAERFFGPARFHDMGNLLLGFSLLSMGMFFAQYLTIWYENLPEETFFIVPRYYRGIWPPVGWAAFLMGYMIPFIVLQSVRLKRNPVQNATVSVLILAGVAMERYVLIVPSVEPDRLMLHPLGALSLLAFAGAMVMAVCLFMTRHAPVSAADMDLMRSDMKLEVLS